MTDLPDTHRHALGWLAVRGGEGVIDRMGRVVAQGEAYRSTETATVWLRLVTTGHVEPAGRSRLRLTADGRAIGATLGNDVNLRDFEGRSALLLSKAKDNNASASLGRLTSSTEAMSRCTTWST